MLVGFNEKRDALSQMQLMCMQARAAEITVVQLSQILNKPFGTLQEHTRRAYAKLRCHKGWEAKQWLEEVGLYLTREQFLEEYQVKKEKVDKAAIEQEQQIRNTVFDSMVDAMLNIHKELGN